MSSMVRKQIYITAELEAALKRLAQTTGESEAELVRQALVSYLQGSSSKSSRVRAWQEERRFIESLQGEDAAQGTRTWSREELYDRADRQVPR
jgi:hypothetical protein